MAFDIGATLDAIHTHLAASARITSVLIGEPKEPPGDSLPAAIWMNSVIVAEVTLSGGTIEVHEVNVRLHKNALTEPQTELETNFAVTVAEITEDLIEAFTLDGTVRLIDMAGIHGTPIGTVFGHVTIKQTGYRIADITVPMIVDDSATAVA